MRTSVIALVGLSLATATAYFAAEYYRETIDPSPVDTTANGEMFEFPDVDMNFPRGQNYVGQTDILGKGSAVYGAAGDEPYFVLITPMKSGNIGKMQTGPSKKRAKTSKYFVAGKWLVNNTSPLLDYEVYCKGDSIFVEINNNTYVCPRGTVFILDHTGTVGPTDYVYTGTSQDIKNEYDLLELLIARLEINKKTYNSL
ncbi:MAG: hypothetical protein HRU15_20395 [Planctomycetes bacterium]|nr:hypothetical protein [Planctomycetota bacterium]